MCDVTQHDGGEIIRWKRFTFIEINTKSPILTIYFSSIQIMSPFMILNDNPIQLLTQHVQVLR